MGGFLREMGGHDAQRVSNAIPSHTQETFLRLREG